MTNTSPFKTNDIILKLILGFFLFLFLQLPSLQANDITPNTVLSTLDPPPDLVVSCKFWFNLRDLDDPNNATFGKVVGTRNDRRKVSTYDIVCPGFCESDGITGYRPDFVQDGLACDYYNEKYVSSHADRKYHLVWGWDGFTNHPEPVNIDVRDLRACGSGQIVRNFQLKEGGRWVTIASQTIWIVNCDRFNINRDNCRDNTDDIEWPLNCNQPNTLDGCGADTEPSNPRLGRPKVVNGGRDNCSMIAIDYKDEYITIVPNACFKILRTWRVVDWCQYHPTRNPYEGKWEYLQVIKVKDNLDPIIIWDSISIDPLDTLFPNGQCGGHATLIIEASDDCTPLEDLRYEYKIDLDNDGLGKYGSYDLFFGSLTKAGTIPTKHDNIYADDTSTVLDASGYYPLGEHKISWFVEDGCGNVVVKDTIFVITDQKAPTPYCETGIITVVMPSSGSITVWASDLDAGSFDNCTDQEDLKLYFNGDTSWTGYIVNCDSIENRGGHISTEFEVELWVEDEAGNTDYCITTIVIQDNQGTCNTNSPNLRGTINTAIGSIIADSLEINVIHNNVVIRSGQINKFGNYILDTIGLPSDVSVQVSLKGNSFINFSTLQLVSVIKHILGKKPFESRRQFLAADLDGNHKIAIKDLIIMRKIILGVYDYQEAEKLGFNVGIKFYPNNCPLEYDSTIIPNTWPIIDDEICSELNWIGQNYSEGELVNFSYYYMGDLSVRSDPQKIEWYMSSIQKDEKGEYISLKWQDKDGINWSAFDMSFETKLNGHFECSNSNIMLNQNRRNTNLIQIVGLNKILKNDAGNNDLEIKYYLDQSAENYTAEQVLKLSNVNSMPTMLDLGETENEITLSTRLNHLAIGEKSHDNITIWPNPIENSLNLNIESKIDETINVRIYSTYGKTLSLEPLDLRIGNNTFLLHTLSKRQPGIYYLSIESTTGKQLKKLIKL